MDKRILLRSTLAVLIILLAIVASYVVFTRRASAPAPQAALAKPWIQAAISDFEGRPVNNPPLSITECVYKEQIVYYVPPRCCDIPAVVYDADHRELCSPTGGLTGSGDGRCADFFTARKDCKTVWQDTRTYAY